MAPTTILFVPLALILAATAIAYWLAGRNKPIAPSGPLPEILEGVLVQRIDERDGSTRLFLQTAPETVVEVDVVDPRTTIDLRVGQALRVEGERRELPDVQGAIVDLREPPEPKRLFRATSVTPLRKRRPTDEDMLGWRLGALAIGGSVPAIRQGHLLIVGLIVALVVLLGGGLALAKRVR